MRHDEQQSQDNEHQNDTNYSESESDDNEDEFVNSQHIQHTAEELSSEITQIFQQNIKEQKNQMTVLQIRRTVREKIFPFMKFTNDYVLRKMKLREHNNMVHFLLQDLNRLDDDDISRAKFWLTYKNEVKSVLTTRKTEVANQMKIEVLNCTYFELMSFEPNAKQ